MAGWGEVGDPQTRPLENAQDAKNTWMQLGKGMIV